MATTVGSLNKLTHDNFIELVTGEALLACEDNFKISSLLIAQSALESGWGKSSLAYKYNNLLGRKWASNNIITKKYVSLKTQEYQNGGYITIYSKFCVYASISDCFRDYLWLLHNIYLDKKKTKLRYQRVLDSKDYKEACSMIKACGYATGKDYDKSLIKIIEEYKLSKYDK